MTLDQINFALKKATRSFQHNDPVYGTVRSENIAFTDFAYHIASIVRKEMLTLARANAIVSNDANELYKDLQAYDRFESGLNY